MLVVCCAVMVTGFCSGKLQWSTLISGAVAIEHWCSGMFFFSLSDLVFQHCPVGWFSSFYFTTLQCGSSPEHSVMNRAFILLASVHLLYLLSLAARTERLCLALSWALHMDIVMYFFSSQDLTLISSPLCCWASLLTSLWVFFILAFNCTFHWGYWVWLASLIL